MIYLGEIYSLCDNIGTGYHINIFYTVDGYYREDAKPDKVIQAPIHTEEEYSIPVRRFKVRQANSSVDVLVIK